MYFTIKKQVANSPVYYDDYGRSEQYYEELEAEVPYKEMMDFVVELVNRDFFNGETNEDYLYSFICELGNEEDIIQWFYDEIVEEFDGRGYFE